MTEKRDPMDVRDVSLPCADEEAAQQFSDYLNSLSGGQVRRIEGRTVVLPVSQQLFLDMVVQHAAEQGWARGMEMVLAAYDAMEAG